MGDGMAMGDGAMRALIVATSATPPDAEQQIRERRLHRIDYLSLAERLAIPWVDDTLGGGGARCVAPLERRLRLDIRLAVRVARLVRSRRYATVFSMSERVAIPLAYLLPRHVRHIVWAQHPLSLSKALLFRALRTPRRWDAILTLSEAERIALCGMAGSAKGRIDRLPYHVDTRFFTPAPAGCQGYLLSVGFTNRDYPTLIRALRTLPAIPARFYIGSNWVGGRLALGQEPNPPNITLHPYVPPQMLRECYRDSRLLAVSIRRDTTQWTAGCTTVLQAQAMGRPVVATRTPGMGDYVLDGETGLLVDPGDPAAMARAIASLWDDPGRLARMGRRASEWVRESRSLDRWLDHAAAILAPNGSLADPPGAMAAG